MSRQRLTAQEDKTALQRPGFTKRSAPAEQPASTGASLEHVQPASSRDRGRPKRKTVSKKVMKVQRKPASSMAASSISHADMQVSEMKNQNNAAPGSPPGIQNGEFYSGGAFCDRFHAGHNAQEAALAAASCTTATNVDAVAECTSETLPSEKKKRCDNEPDDIFAAAEANSEDKNSPTSDSFYEEALEGPFIPVRKSREGEDGESLVVFPDADIENRLQEVESPNDAGERG